MHVIITHSNVVSTDIKQSSFIKKDPQSLPDLLLSPLILENNIASSASVLFGKNFEFPTSRRSPSPSWVRGHKTRDLPANKYSHKLPKHRPAVKRPRSSEPPLSSFIDYVPRPGFRTPPFPSSCRRAPKYNSFDSSRHGRFDESYAILPALKHEPVVVRLVQDVEDVQVKEVNGDLDPPSFKEGPVPVSLPVVEEPEAANSLIAEVNLLVNRDNYPGLLVRILRMFWGYLCRWF